MKQVEARIAQVGMYNPATAMASAQRRALGIGLDAREAQALGPEYAAMTAAQARLEAAERVVKVVEDQKRLREQEIATNQRTRELMMELNKAMQGADKNTKRMVEIMLGNSNPLAKFFQKLDLPEWGDMREGTDDLGKLRDEQMARPVYEGL
jgi:Holliday junction resolvasome RuvABC ATP-dependent DNA helicase subunit